jgi:hypothetical protein
MNRKSICALLCAMSLGIAGCDDSAGGDDGARPVAPSPGPRLAALSVTPGALAPQFFPDNFSYTLSLDDAVSEITVAVEPAEGFSVCINGAEPDDSGATVVDIGTGSDDVIVTALSPAGETRDYSIRIVRTFSSEIANWSFESSDVENAPLNWTMNSTGKFAVYDGGAHDGTHAGYFTSLTGQINGREVLSDPVAIDPSMGLTLSAWIYLPQTGGDTQRAGVGIKCFYYTDPQCLNPCESASATRPKVSPETENTWKQVVFPRTAAQIPEDAWYVRIGLRACYDASHGGTEGTIIYIDSVSITQP